jgi:hypothetical protein
MNVTKAHKHNRAGTNSKPKLSTSTCSNEKKTSNKVSKQVDNRKVDKFIDI